MALTVTPGSETADAYADVAFCDAYHAARGNATWAGTDELKEQAIRRATRWLDGQYRAQYPGIRWRGRLQALEWPRSDAMDLEGYGIDPFTVPREIQQAMAEAALRELVAPGALAPDYVATGTVKSEQVGPLRVEYTGASGSAAAAPVLMVVADILGGLFRVNSGSVAMVVRA